jgi:hypothetical protein
LKSLHYFAQHQSYPQTNPYSERCRAQITAHPGDGLFGHCPGPGRRATGAGVKSDWIDLPTLGIKGNSHMMMMDRNSDQIAEVVAKWLEQSRAD